MSLLFLELISVLKYHEITHDEVRKIINMLFFFIYTIFFFPFTSQEQHQGSRSSFPLNPFSTGSTDRTYCNSYYSLQKRHPVAF